MSGYLKNAFNAGIFSPSLRFRADLAKFKNACAELENFFVLPQGGIENRPGTEFILEAGNPADDSRVRRLVPFVFSSTEFALLEFCSGSSAANIRCHWLASGIWQSAESVPASGAVNYTASQIPDLKFHQSNDILWIAHPDVPPQILKRTLSGGSYVFTLEPFSVKGGPYEDENDNESVTVNASAVSGNAVTLTAYAVAGQGSSVIFKPGHVGAMMRLRHLTGSAGTLTHTFNEDNYQTPSASVNLSGAWTIQTSQSWVGTLVLQRSTDNGATWKLYRSWTFNADNNVDDSGYEDDPAVLYRCIFQNWGTAPEGVLYECRVTLANESYLASGEARITSVASDGKSATATVITPFFSTAKTDLWAFGEWSAQNGFPAIVAFYPGDRLVFAGTKKQPQKIWMSKVGGYNDFYEGTGNDDALAVTIHNTKFNELRWLLPKKKLLIAASADAIGVLSGDDENKPITVENVRYSPELEIGASRINPVPVGETTLFFQRGNRQLMELGYDFASDNYVSPNVSILAGEMLKSSVKECAFRQLPYPVLFALLENGRIACFTYDRAEDVKAWSWMTTGGDFKSVCVIPTDGEEDSVFFIVRRSAPDSSVKYCIEKLAMRRDGSAAEGWYLDCASRSVSANLRNYAVPPAAIGDLVYQAVSDGGSEEPKPLDENGHLLLQKPGKNILCGIPFRSLMRTLPLELASGTESTMSIKKSVPEITLKFLRTIGGSVFSEGVSGTFPVIRRRTTDRLGLPLEPQTDSVRVSVPNLPRIEQTFTVIQDEPYPLTLLAAVAETES